MLWTGAAAITAGVLLFLSNLFSEFLLPGEKDGEIVRLGLGLVYIAAYGLELWHSSSPCADSHASPRRGRLTRAGHNGLRVAAAGAAFQALFAAVYFATAAATGDAADAAFFLYAFGFLFLIGGSITAGVSMIRTGAQRPLGALLLVAASGGDHHYRHPGAHSRPRVLSVRRRLGRCGTRADSAGEVGLSWPPGAGMELGPMSKP